MTQIDLGENTRKIIIEILKNQDIKKETKEEIAKTLIDWLKPKYLIKKNSGIEWSSHLSQR